MVNNCGKNIVLIKTLHFTLKYLVSYDPFFDEKEPVWIHSNYGQRDNNFLAAQVAQVVYANVNPCSNKCKL